LDNNPEAYQLQTDLGCPIIDYLGEKDDIELLRYNRFLAGLADVSDSRNIAKACQDFFHDRVQAIENVHRFKRIPSKRSPAAFPSSDTKARGSCFKQMKSAPPPRRRQMRSCPKIARRSQLTQSHFFTVPSNFRPPSVLADVSPQSSTGSGLIPTTTGKGPAISVMAGHTTVSASVRSKDNHRPSIRQTASLQKIRTQLTPCHFTPPANFCPPTAIPRVSPVIVEEEESEEEEPEATILTAISFAATAATSVTSVAKNVIIGVDNEMEEPEIDSPQFEDEDVDEAEDYNQWDDDLESRRSDRRRRVVRFASMAIMAIMALSTAFAINKLYSGISMMVRPSVPVPNILDGASDLINIGIEGPSPLRDAIMPEYDSALRTNASDPEPSNSIEDDGLGSYYVVVNGVQVRRSRRVAATIC